VQSADAFDAAVGLHAAVCAERDVQPNRPSWWAGYAYYGVSLLAATRPLGRGQAPEVNDGSGLSEPRNR
jgi:hypothetical protein